MLSLSYKDKLATMVQWNPWTWIALLYASQVLGALLVALAFRIDLGGLGISIWLLVVGTLHAIATGFWARIDESSKQDWVPALVYAAFIISMSHRSLKDIYVPINVNFFHPLEYAVLAIFFCWMGHAMLLSGRVHPLILRVISGGFAFAVLDELHQFFIPGRTASFVDLALDLIGLCLGCGIFFIGRHLRNGFAASQELSVAK